jgi:hypothetical protein
MNETADLGVSVQKVFHSILGYIWNHLQPNLIGLAVDYTHDNGLVVVLLVAQKGLVNLEQAGERISLVSRQPGSESFQPTLYGWVAQAGGDYDVARRMLALPTDDEG